VRHRLPVRPGRHPADAVIVALALPALASLATDPLYSLIDTAFVAHLGTIELGAVAVGSAAFNESFWIFSFLAYGVTLTVARSVGAGDELEAARVGAQALLLALGLGAVVTGVALLHGHLFPSLHERLSDGLNEVFKSARTAVQPAPSTEAVDIQRRKGQQRT
jgi:Na+-driven multidrug efflux pump